MGQQQGPPMGMPMVRPMMMGVPRPAPMLVPQQMFVPRQPPMFMQRPGVPGGPGGPGGNRPQQDEPPNKKQKTEDNLIPEAEFMAKNPPNVTDKPEWKLNGQMLMMTFPLQRALQP